VHDNKKLPQACADALRSRLGSGLMGGAFTSNGNGLAGVCP
jgi:hypothetical protein